MPKVGRTEELRDLARKLDPAKRFVDLAVQLRVLNDDGTPGRLLPNVIGGRWDTWTEDWVRPQPADLRIFEWTIQEQQIEALLDTPFETIFIGIFAGRQAGKTHLAFMADVLDMIRSPTRRCGIVIQNFDTLEEFAGALEPLFAPWWNVKSTKSKRRFAFPHGAEIVFRSKNAINSLRGPSLKRIHLTEAALMKRSCFTTAVGCGTASKDFVIEVETTPKREVEWIREIDETWDHRSLAKRAQHLKGTRLYRLRTDDNPRRNMALIELIRAVTPPDIVAQEFDGLMLAPQNLAYSIFRRRDASGSPVHVLPVPELGAVDCTHEFAVSNGWSAEANGKCEFLIGWDFGHEAAILVRAFRLAGRRDIVFWVVGEHVSERNTTDAHAVAVIRKYSPASLGAEPRDMKAARSQVWTDAMGQHQGAIAGAAKSGVALLRQAGFRDVRPHGTRNPDTSVGVRVVSALFESVKYGRRLFVTPECKHLIAALEAQRMGPKGRPITGDGHEHVLDALKYLFLRVSPIRSEWPAGFEPLYGDSEA